MLNCFCAFDDKCCCKGDFIPKKLSYTCEFGGACSFQIGFKDDNPPKSECGDSKNSTPSAEQHLKDSISLLLKQRDSILLAGLPYSESWAQNLMEIIAKLESI